MATDYKNGNIQGLKAKIQERFQAIGDYEIIRGPSNNLQVRFKVSDKTQADHLKSILQENFKVFKKFDDWQTADPAYLTLSSSQTYFLAGFPDTNDTSWSIRFEKMMETVSGRQRFAIPQPKK